MPHKKTLSLRPHHLLCLSTFAGAGYSPAFIANMRRIKGAYCEPARPVRIVPGLDDICARCPHAGALECEKAPDLVAEMDERALETLAVEPGREYAAATLHRRVAAARRDKRLNDVCSRCEWFAVFCSERMA